MSRKYSNLTESFNAASNGKTKINFEDFKTFVEKERALAGFNLTLPLLQKLFAELDPHKKAFLSFNDWKNAFQSFNWRISQIVPPFIAALYSHDKSLGSYRTITSVA